MLGSVMPEPCNAAMVTDAASGQDVAPTVPEHVTLVHDKPGTAASFITAPTTVLGPELVTVMV